MLATTETPTVAQVLAWQLQASQDREQEIQEIVSIQCGSRTSAQLRKWEQKSSSYH